MNDWGKVHVAMPYFAFLSSQKKRERVCGHELVFRQGEMLMGKKAYMRLFFVVAWGVCVFVLLAKTLGADTQRLLFDFEMRNASRVR